MKKRKWLLTAGATALMCLLITGCGQKQADQEEYRALIEETKSKCEYVADKVVADGEGVQVTFVGIDEDGKYSTEYGEQEEPLWIFAVSNSSKWNLNEDTYPLAYAYVNGGYDLYLNYITNGENLNPDGIQKGKNELLYFSLHDTYTQMLQALGEPVQFSDISIIFYPAKNNSETL